VTRIRGIDVVWLLFLLALAALGLTQPDHSPWEWPALLALGGLQMAEGYLGWTETARKASGSIAAKLLLCYALVWATGGIESSYYLIFLLPIVSGASFFGLGGALAVCGVSSALYLSFLLYVLDTYYVPPDGQRELTVRILFFFLSATLVNRLATENRLKTQRLGQAYRELSEAQAEVRRSERLAALGQLSAGLAHEIRNPLGVISASAELLAKNVAAENEVAREVAGFIGAEVTRTNALVTRFLDFARPSKLHREVQPLLPVVERALQTLHDTAKPGDPAIRVETSFGDVPPFSFDATLIESSVVNLLLNAREAMTGGGTLRVEVEREGGFARIAVADDGPGVPADKIEDVFNPFFTTKPRGVGLGLAMVSKFVDSHGGTISLDSPPGQGARFRILLPLDTDR
jgi:two-component system, NtrC family, sensor histidine kinase HydH